MRTPDYNLFGINNLKHQNHQSDCARLRAGEIELQVDHWTATVKGESINLTYLEYRLLQELIQARGSVLTREAVLQSVWGYDNDSRLPTRTVDVHMGRLRRKLGKSGRHIITVRKVGYRMVIWPNWTNRSDEHWKNATSAATENK